MYIYVCIVYCILIKIRNARKNVVPKRMSIIIELVAFMNYVVNKNRSTEIHT